MKQTKLDLITENKILKFKLNLLIEAIYRLNLRWLINFLILIFAFVAYIYFN